MATKRKCYCGNDVQTMLDGGKVRELATCAKCSGTV